jgi:hypothetical protein
MLRATPQCPSIPEIIKRIDGQRLDITAAIEPGSRDFP